MPWQVVRLFVDRLGRVRRRIVHTETYSETTVWFDIPGENGIVPAGVPRRPPDLSGSGSEALTEPSDGFASRDIQ